MRPSNKFKKQKKEQKNIKKITIGALDIFL
jgi:hypothetical protein